MDQRHLLARGERPLTIDQAEWKTVARTVGLTPYVCKASFVCGLMREFIATASLSLGDDRHIGSIFIALDATELLGRCVGGFQGTPGAGQRLKVGIEYLENLADPSLPPLRHTSREYAALRNFAGHGAASLERGVSFDQKSGLAILERLVAAVNVMWSDASLDSNFAKAEVHPLTTVDAGRRVPVFVEKVQEHLKAGFLPGERTAHEEWRRLYRLSNESPAATGRSWAPGVP